jgi:hypothetical protein
VCRPCSGLTLSLKRILLRLSTVNKPWMAASEISEDGSRLEGRYQGGQGSQRAVAPEKKNLWLFAMLSEHSRRV